MLVKIIANKGNEFYDQFIGNEYEAMISNKGIYTIKDIPTKTNLVDYKGALMGTQWTKKEVKKVR